MPEPTQAGQEVELNRYPGVTVELYKRVGSPVASSTFGLRTSVKDGSSRLVSSARTPATRPPDTATSSTL